MPNRQAHRAKILGNLATAVSALVFLYKKSVATQGAGPAPSMRLPFHWIQFEIVKTRIGSSWTTLQLWIVVQELARPSSTGSANSPHQAAYGRVATLRSPSRPRLFENCQASRH